MISNLLYRSLAVAVIGLFLASCTATTGGPKHSGIEQNTLRQEQQPN